MFKIDLKTFARKATDIWQKDKLKLLMSPSFSWGILVSLFFILLIASALANIYFFLSKDVKDIITPSGVSDVNTEDRVVLNTKDLEATILLFEEKVFQFEKLKKEKPFAVDPSL